MRKCIVLAAFMVAFAFSLQVAAKGNWIKDARTGCAIWNAAPGPNEAITWSGPCNGGKAHGKGVLQWIVKGKPAGRYEGEFRNGRKHGRGIYAWANGARYEGEYRNGRMSGRGAYFWADGARYKGEWRNSKPHGRGIKRWANGGRYSGGWRNGRKHGRGAETWPNGNRYEGEYRNGKAHGRGVEVFASGARYKGGWRNGKPHGSGTYTNARGSKFSGSWANGCFNQGGRRAWLGTTKAKCASTKNKQTAKNGEMELNPGKGHAVCKKKRNGGWLCDGPLQKVSSGKRPLKKALKMSGCKGPDFIGVWTSWQLYQCSQDVGRRNILKKYNII